MLADDYEALRRTVYGEARNQPLDGQYAVAFTVMNRLRHPRLRWWGTSVEAICLKPHQYSCWNEGDPNRVVIAAASENLPPFLKASIVAATVLLSLRSDNTEGATHYHTVHAPSGARSWPPYWAKSMKPTGVIIGSHVFYREE